MSSSTPVDDVQPRKLNSGDKVFLSFAFLVTMVRVAGLVGFSIFLLMYSFGWNAHNLRMALGGVALYAVGTFVMVKMMKVSNARADRYRAQHAAL